tara:strand:+ start:4793 stop:5674 length:882 start_codon:yes stop_codon:yes gene_type:complete
MEFKPRPYTKREFLDKLVMPYENPETQQEVVGNPNQIPSETRPGQPDPQKVERALQVSVKDDTNKEIKITLKDIDSSILYYLENVIRPTVMQNDKQQKVPVIYGSPERWKSMQADGFYRDKNGKTMVPLVMFKRSSFEKDNTIGNKLDGNKVHNVEYFETRYSRRNNYDNFSVLQNQLPQREYILGVIPDYLTINYEMSIFTDFTEQMNEITEAIEFSARSYWGDPEKFMFRADIKTFNTPTLLESGVDRANKTDMTLIVNAYIIPKTINVSMAGPSPKAYNIVKTVFGEQII